MTDASGLARLLAAWVALVQRHSIVVLVLSVGLAAGALHLAINDLGIVTSTSDMISEDTEFIRIKDAFSEPFPATHDNFTIVVEADTPDQRRDAVAGLAADLRARPDLYEVVHTPGAGAFFAQNGLLFLDQDKLLDLLDSLSDAQPLLQRLRQDMTLRGLLAVLGLAIDDAMGQDDSPDGLDWLFARMAAVVGPDGDAVGRLSWQEIMYGREAEPGDLRGFIIVKPKLDGDGELLPGNRALNEAHAIADAAGLSAADGIRVSLTGSLALARDELQTVERGAALSGILSLCLVTVILVLGLRALNLVLLSLVTLVIGLIWTAGFATLAIGHLNLISVAFAVLFVSLSIDYSIHIVLQAREFVGNGADSRVAMRDTARGIGGALLLCALTTAIGFYAFLPTDYAGVSELGVIAGTGMFIGLFANLTVLPALLALWPIKAPAARAPGRLDRFAAALSAWPQDRARKVQIGGGLAALIGVALVPMARFDFNPINLQDPHAESVAILRTLMAEGDRGLFTAGLRVADGGDVAATAARLDALDLVDFTVTLNSFVPPEQDDRLGLLEDIAFVVTPDGFATESFPPPDAAAQEAALGQFATALDRLIAAHGPAVPGARALAAAIAAAGTGAVDSLEPAWIGTLPARLDELDRALEAAPFGVADLPPDLVDRYRGIDGSQRIQIFPAEDIMADNAALRRFVAALRTVDRAVTDDPVVILEAGNTVIGAFAQALLSALAVIALLLLAMTRRLADSLRILAPLALAALVTGAATVMIAMPFNFANIIVLPLLLGIGVHSAIHLMHRYRLDPSRPLLSTSTARAVLFSALTTIGGFGSLAVSPHLGTASMGWLLVIGVSATLVCTLILMPALLPMRAAIGDD